MIHCVLIAYENPEQTRIRWLRDLVPGLTLHGQPYSVTVVDNSKRRSDLLAGEFDSDYLWQGGENLLYGPSLNLAAARRPSEFILYVCTRHGHALDPRWVGDLMTPFTDPQVGAAGHLRGSNSPEGVAQSGGPGCEWVAEKYRFPDGVQQHIQGGVFAARTKLMLEHPYPAQFPHMYTDHLFTWAVLKAGYRCADVPTILSLWRDRATPQELLGVRFIHDDNHL